MKVGVVYVASGQSSEEDIYANIKPSRDFQDFVHSLGWDVLVANHGGFVGGLDRKLSTGTTAPYFANFASEVIYHVAPLMPNNGSNQHKKVV